MNQQQRQQSNSYNSMISLTPASPTSAIIGQDRVENRRYNLTMRRPLENQTRPLDNALLRGPERIQLSRTNSEDHCPPGVMRRAARVPLSWRLSSEGNNRNELETGQRERADDEDFFLVPPRHSLDYYLLMVPNLP